MQALFESVFSDIDEFAVPPTSSDHMYAPLVLRYHDPDTSALAGAALACRAQVAATAMLAGGRLPGNRDYRTVLDKHRELDLMCVAPAFRDRGIGGALLTAMREELAAQGVRVWFGNAIDGYDLDGLRRFYTRHGFTVLADGEPLPPLLGKDWTMPTVVAPAPRFYFYQRLTGSAGQALESHPAA